MIHLPKMENRLPVGPGSRGGHWHEPEYRKAYFRAWRAAHPDYREREHMRLARRRPLPYDPADSRSAAVRMLPGDLCRCGCECREVVVQVCGFCRDGLCEEAS